MRSDYAVITARSPRVVVLLPDLDSASDFGVSRDAELDRVLEWFGRVWGGAHMTCLPVSGGLVRPVFLRLAAAYDPDLVLPWQPTVGSMALADLEASRKLVSDARSRPELADSSALAALDTDEALLSSDLFVGSRVDPDMLTGQLPTFAGPDTPLACAFHRQTALPKPLTRLALLGRAPALDWRSRPLAPTTAAAAAQETIGRPVTDLDLSGLDPWRKRLLKARFGVLGSTGPAEPSPGGQPTAWTTVDPEVDATAIASAGLTGAYAGRTASGWTEDHVLAGTPTARSTTGLQTWSYGRAFPRPFLVVAGDTIEDFCLYLCWLRVYGEGSAAWLPAASVPDSASADPEGISPSIEGILEVAREMLLDLPGQTYRGGWITSFSMPTDQLEILRGRLSESHWNADILARFAAMTIVAPDSLPVEEPPPFYVATGDVFERVVPLFIHDDGIAGAAVRSPVPQLLTDHSRTGRGALLGNWVADVTVARCRFPTRRQAVHAAELDTSVIEEGLARVGRTGTAYVAVGHHDQRDELHVDHALTTLSLRDPDLGALLTQLLPDGFSWQLSDAGRFYQGFADMAGGLPGLVAMLRDPAVSGILNGFLNTDDEGGGLVLTDKRRYMRSFDCRTLMRASAGSEATTVPGARAVLDRLLAARILTRGLVLKCSRCRFTAFQPLSAVNTEFVCPRCSFTQPLTSAAWCDTPPHEPAWFYRLDELVFQALLKNVRVPALALDHLGASSPNARHLWSLELVQNNKRLLELDFLALVNGQLLTGEAKSNGKLTGKAAENEVRKTLRGARLVQADRVVFATTDPQWSEPLKLAVQSQVSALDRPTAVPLTGLT